ncbi:hypothetical protein K402DRAFT_32971 [Aulographum hederae CBS 113979]|uniref:Mid2 domain-containing protein n=1 Tax=Aulographum hederae CBS 113979 TaxID=1176131 RepID=A0A6G1H5H5_9PEZI|nr:hypothetical protein K402DRAFT_32971 [Aulographum hederae CBS 113979]
MSYFPTYPNLSCICHVIYASCIFLSLTTSVAAYYNAEFYSPPPWVQDRDFGSNSVYTVGTRETLHIKYWAATFNVSLFQDLGISNARGTATPIFTQVAPQNQICDFAIGWVVQLYDFDLSLSNVFFIQVGANGGGMVSHSFNITEGDEPSSSLPARDSTPVVSSCSVSSSTLSTLTTSSTSSASVSSFSEPPSSDLSSSESSTSITSAATSVNTDANTNRNNAEITLVLPSAAVSATASRSSDPTASATASASTDSSSPSLKLVLGLTLGIGIPILILLALLLYFRHRPSTPPSSFTVRAVKRSNSGFSTASSNSPVGAAATGMEKARVHPNMTAIRYHEMSNSNYGPWETPGSEVGLPKPPDGIARQHATPNIAYAENAAFAGYTAQGLHIAAPSIRSAAATTGSDGPPPSFSSSIPSNADAYPYPDEKGRYRNEYHVPNAMAANTIRSTKTTATARTGCSAASDATRSTNTNTTGCSGVSENARWGSREGSPSTVNGPLARSPESGDRGVLNPEAVSPLTPALERLTRAIETAGRDERSNGKGGGGAGGTLSPVVVFANEAARRREDEGGSWADLTRR